MSLNFQKPLSASLFFLWQFSLLTHGFWSCSMLAHLWHWFASFPPVCFSLSMKWPTRPTIHQHMNTIMIIVFCSHSWEIISLGQLCLLIGLLLVRLVIVGIGEVIKCFRSYRQSRLNERKVWYTWQNVSTLHMQYLNLFPLFGLLEGTWLWRTWCRAISVLLLISIITLTNISELLFSHI